jgi:hypothetical protein
MIQTPVAIISDDASAAYAARSTNDLRSVLGFVFPSVVHPAGAEQAFGFVWRFVE